MLKYSSKSLFLVLALSVFALSNALAANNNTATSWHWTLPADNDTNIVIPSLSEEEPLTVPPADTSVLTVHIVPSTGGLFEETLQFSGDMIVSANSEEATLLQEYDSDLKITTVKVKTSAPVTLYCHGSGRLLGRKAPLLKQAPTIEPPESPACDGDQIVLKNKKHHWLVVKQPQYTETKLRKWRLDDLLEGMPNRKVPFLPELGTDIIAYPEYQADGSGDGDDGKKWNPWAKYSKDYDVSDDEEDEDNPNKYRESKYYGKPCPNCGIAPCPRCGMPHCLPPQIVSFLELLSILQQLGEVALVFDPHSLAIAIFIVNQMRGGGNKNT